MTDSNKRMPTLVYLLAASHSGSTLTAMLLNAHPDICTAGELKASHLGDPSSYLCSCHSLIRDCDFWNSVSTEMSTRGFDYDISNAQTALEIQSNRFVSRLLRPLHRGRLLELIRDGFLRLTADWRKFLPEWKRRNKALVESIGAVSKSGFVVDSSKIGIRLKYLCRTKGLPIKIVRVVRDGRAVALTYMDPSGFADARDENLRGGGSGIRVDEDESMADAANQWLRSNQEAEAFLKTVPGDSHIQIRYEDLCRDPGTVMSGVHEFLGLAPEPDGILKFREFSHHVVGNGMRLDGDSQIILDERWRDVLGERDLQTFDRIAGQLNRSYGYE